MLSRSGSSGFHRDPHRDAHALAVVRVTSGGVIFEATVAASSDARARAVLVSLVDRGFPPMRAAGARGKLGAWLRTARARMKRLKKPLTEPERAERKREWGDD